VSSAGNVIGSFPDGFTSPKRTAAIASPLRSPGYQAWTTAATRDNHGISTGPEV
jgi:hypothetical protein